MVDSPPGPTYINLDNVSVASSADSSAKQCETSASANSTGKPKGIRSPSGGGPYKCHFTDCGHKGCVQRSLLVRHYTRVHFEKDKHRAWEEVKVSCPLPSKIFTTIT